jgi:hypothetical protein
MCTDLICFDRLSIVLFRKATSHSSKIEFVIIGNFLHSSLLQLRRDYDEVRDSGYVFRVRSPRLPRGWVLTASATKERGLETSQPDEKGEHGEGGGAWPDGWVLSVRSDVGSLL